MIFALVQTVPEPHLSVSSNPQEATLDRERIVEELKKERDRISQAIAALGGQSAGASSSNSAGAKSAARGRRRVRLTPEGRKRLSDMMKRRWAELRKKNPKG
jgi:hypothetical protein